MGCSWREIGRPLAGLQRWRALCAVDILRLKQFSPPMVSIRRCCGLICRSKAFPNGWRIGPARNRENPNDDRVKEADLSNTLRLGCVGTAIASALLLAAAVATGPAVAQQTADSGAALFTLKPLGHNVFAAIPNPGSGAGGNSAFIIGDDGVAIVDTFQTVAAARQLPETIHKQTQLPVKFVVNTHYHLDHVAGNRVFAEAGAVIFAQTNVRDWIHSENPKFFGAAITPAQKTMVAELFAPEVVYEKGIDLSLGSPRLEMRDFHRATR